MNIYLSLLVSLLYFIAVFYVALKLKTKHTEYPRIFIHIMTANWYLIAQYFIADKLISLSIPALLYLFHIINNNTVLLPKIYSASENSRYGFLYTSLAMILLIYFTFDNQSSRLIAGVGILSLGYGDGLASYIGMKYGKHHFTIFKGSKSIEGSLAMFFSVILVLTLYLNVLNGISAFTVIFAVAFLSTLTEAISPYGLDNLFIPILASLLYYIWIF